MMHDVGCFDHAIKLSPSEWKNNSVKGLCPWLSKFDIKVMIIMIFNFALLKKSTFLKNNALYKSYSIVYLKIVRIRVIYKKDLLHVLVQKCISLSQPRRYFYLGFYYRKCIWLKPQLKCATNSLKGITLEWCFFIMQAFYFKWVQHEFVIFIKFIQTQPFEFL